MTIFEKPARKLIAGDVMALPMGKTATIEHLTVGRKFVTIRTEYGISRIELNAPVLLQVEES